MRIINRCSGQDTKGPTTRRVTESVVMEITVITGFSRNTLKRRKMNVFIQIISRLKRGPEDSRIQSIQVVK